jgi:regulator of protease activity HflC (stomatin/prohibitin superfamily)
VPSTYFPTDAEEFAAAQAKDKKRNFRAGIAIIGTIALVALVIGVIITGPTLTKTDGGTVIVVRNGGWFDDTSVRDVVPPNSSITWEGWHSTEHPYPASQRFFKVGNGSDADSNEVINVPTKDGVNVGVTGIFYFQLNTDHDFLVQFDDSFGTRTFDGGDGKQVHAWDENGWSPFLKVTIGNLVQNVLRSEIGAVRCQDLVASCALAFNAAATVDTTQAATGNATLSSIQDAVNSGFSADVQRNLGMPMFTNIQFVLSQITLPENTQNAINDSFSKVATQAGETQAAAGRLLQAETDAKTNSTRQQGYLACPVCGEIDLRKSIPGGVTVWAPGGDTPIAVPATPPAG